TLQELESGRASIKQGLQLVTQTMLLIIGEEPKSRHAEALATLTFIASECLKSPLLNKEIVRLTNDYFIKHLQSVLNGAGSLAATDVFWIANLLDSIQMLDQVNAKKIADLKSLFTESIEKWSGSF